eukprot:scaffold306_cov525-Prasinococcus_capsulatus_cf.AAC.63
MTLSALDTCCMHKLPKPRSQKAVQRVRRASRNDTGDSGVPRCCNPLGVGIDLQRRASTDDRTGTFQSQWKNARRALAALVAGHRVGCCGWR